MGIGLVVRGQYCLLPEEKRESNVISLGDTTTPVGGRPDVLEDNAVPDILNWECLRQFLGHIPNRKQ